MEITKIRLPTIHRPDEIQSVNGKGVKLVVVVMVTCVRGKVDSRRLLLGCSANGETNLHYRHSTRQKPEVLYFLAELL